MQCALFVALAYTCICELCRSFLRHFFLQTFIVSILYFFIDSYVCYLKSFSLIELGVQRLWFSFLLHWTRENEWKGQMKRQQKWKNVKDFISAFWANCLIRFNKKPERWIVFVMLWIIADCNNATHADCVRTVYIATKYSQGIENFTAGKVNKYIDRFAIEFKSQWSQSLRAKIGKKNRRGTIWGKETHTQI